MNIEKLEKVLANEPKFRLKQTKEAVFQKFISSWNEASFLPKDLREKLNKECSLSIKADILVSRPKWARLAEAAKKSDCIKARITLEDNLEIESVLMCHKDGRNTVCVSSQVGCPLGCEFCVTGKMGFKRNLTTAEIVEQAIFFERYLKKENKRVSNIAFMGMGEPFLNYDNVLNAVRILNDKEYFNIGARNISISTAGIIEGIKKLADERLQINLAISLHASNNKLRSSLMPINKKYLLEEVLKAVDFYIKKTNRKVMFEYVLIKDVNDLDKNAEELAKIMNKKLYFVNLILYNATDSFAETRSSLDYRERFSASETKRLDEFKKILKKNKIVFSQRYRFGEDIKAACGQFATNS
jgi:23S rRNA (adenine2503-C2)-methyltransferase